MRTVLYLLPLLGCVACSKYVIDVDDETNRSATQLSVAVRSSAGTDDDAYYPIRVFVFDEKGQYVSQQEISAVQQSFSTKLSPRKYSISAFGGLDNGVYSFQETPQHSDVIEMKGGVWNAASPLMSGHYDIDLSESSNLVIPMTYCVSALRFSYTEVPSDATGVCLSVSPLGAGYTFGGEYTEGTEGKAVIECTKENGEWKAGPVYVFPSSESSRTLLSVTVRRGTESETYDYTYGHALQAAQPYNFKGKYKEGLKLETDFEIEGWAPVIDVEYDLVESEAGGDTGTEGNTGEDVPAILYAETLPEENTIWKSFYVWTVTEISPTETEAVIIAPQQWPEVLAADAGDILNGYVEDGVSQWRTFTEDEVRAFYDRFSAADDYLGALNKLLSDNGHNYFYCYNKERYLCKNEEYSFCLYGGLRITPVGSKTRYYLRPVKTVRVRLR